MYGNEIRCVADLGLKEVRCSLRSVLASSSITSNTCRGSVGGGSEG